MALLVADLLLVIPPQCRADDPTLEEIYDAMREWRASFATLRIVYEVRSAGQKYDQPPTGVGPPPADGVVYRYDWTRSDQGKVKCRQQRYFNRLLTHDDLDGSDGKVSYEADFTVNEQGHSAGMKELILRRERMPNPGLKYNIQPLNMIWNGRSGLWLADEFKRRGSSLIDFVEHEAVRMPEIQFGPANLVILDPRYSYLPRSRRPDTSAERPDTIEFTVEEFRILPNGLSFPWSGRERIEATSYNVRFQVIRAEPNIRLTDRFFDPPTPETGTTVIDRISGGQYVVGADGTGEVAARAAAARAEQLAVTGPPVEAVAPESAVSRWAWRFGILSVLLLVTSAVLRRRSSPSTSN